MPDNGAIRVEHLAEFVVHLGREDLPTEVLMEGKRSLLNVLAASAGAMDSPIVSLLRTWVLDTQSHGVGRILWSADRSAPGLCALVNTAAMHVLDFDDIHITSHVHAGAPVVGAGLALVDPSTSGERFVRSVVLGMEVEFALGEQLMPAHFRRGYHVTATVGAVGAAAASCILLGLNLEQTSHALAAAMLNAGALREGLTSMSNANNVGNSARSGVEVTQLALLGVRSSLSALDGPEGMLKAMGDGIGVSPPTSVALGGSRWTILENSYKRYPTESLTQAIVQGVLRLRGDVDDNVATSIIRIEISAAPLTAEIVNIRSVRVGVPVDRITRTFDTKFCAAVAWCLGRFDSQSLDLEPDIVPQVVDLRARCSLEADPDLGVDQARVAVIVAGGERIETFVDGFTGSARNPMSEEDLEQKLVTACSDGGWRSEEIIESVWRLDEAESMRKLLALVVRP